MRRLMWLLVGLILGVSVALGIPAVAATPHNVAGCNNHAGVEFDSHLAYLCVNGINGEGTLYWTQYLYTFQYYWHPNSGSMVVTETYYKPPGYLAGKVCNAGTTVCPPLVTPFSLPLPPRSNGRIVTLADGCVVSAPTLNPVPTFCTSTSQGGQPAETHQMTPVEQHSIDSFWKIMFASVPDKAW